MVIMKTMIQSLMHKNKNIGLSDKQTNFVQVRGYEWVGWRNRSSAPLQVLTIK